MRTRAPSFFLLAFSVSVLACGDDSDDGGTTGATNPTVTVGAGATGGMPTGGTGGTGGMGTGGGTGGMGTGGGTGGEATGPTVSFTVNPGTVQAGGDVLATVTVSNFTLQEPGMPNADGIGHYHIYLDDADGGNYLVSGASPTVELTIDTTPGAHTLRINLTENNHAPLQPAVEDVIDLTVE